MSDLGRELLNILMAIGIVVASAAIVMIPLAFIQRVDRDRKKRRTIWTQAKRLGSLLRARYGPQQAYTPDQVKRMMREWGYSTPYDCYGLAMYCSQADFVDYHRSRGESCNYDAMRSEISHCLFQADMPFSVSDIFEADIQFNHSDSGSHHHHDSGSDSGHPSYHHDSGGDSGGHYGGDSGGYY
jgi:hypothetical protein